MSEHASDFVVAPVRRVRRPLLGSTPPTVPPARPSPRGIGTRPPVKPRLTVKQREVLNALRDAYEPVPAAGLEPHTGLSIYVIRRALADLRELGLALPERQRAGAGGTVWMAT